jgi:methylenetetrahydrofolate dehydrogenase (NADP+)/methenyltetrahydrofolate cyclohydrolase
MSVKLDGKLVSNEIYESIKRGRKYQPESKILAIVTVGDDEASKVYVNTKKKKAVECGYKYMHIQMSDNTHFFELDNVIKNLNENVDVKGIIIQKPLPNELSNWEKQIDEIIDPSKDVDGFHPMSKFKSCTPKGVMTLLDHYNVPYKGKNVVIAGRSKIVAKPLAEMLMAKNCTVTMIHSKTPEPTVRSLIENCDVFISAIGKPHYWTEDYFDCSYRKIALVDVGINRVFNEDLEKNVVVGDVDPKCYQYFDYYTPVPGGVGLMTVATLIDNLYKS